MRRLFVVALLLVVPPAFAQEKSVKPGINDAFKNPDVEKYKGTFEGESREVYVHREKLVAACGLKPGMVVFASVVGDTGLSVVVAVVVAVLMVLISGGPGWQAEHHPSPPAGNARRRCG